MKKSIVLFAVLFLTITLTFTIADAQKAGYPTAPITLINPMPTGGAVEISNRALSKYLQESFGKPVLLEIRAGGQGTIAGKYVADAKPDGYTIGTFGFPAYSPEAYSRLIKAPYTSKELVPVVRWLGFPFGLTSLKNRPWTDLNEFVKYVQNNPKKIKLGHLGFGHPYHIMYYALAKEKKLDMIEIPFKGSGDLKVAILGGHVDVGMTSLASVKPFVDAGKLSFLAIQNPKRMAEYPNIPTFGELGYKFGYYATYGLFVPKGTPDEVKKRIHDAVKKAVEIPALKEFAKENVLDLYYGSAGDLSEDVRKDIETIGPLVDEIIKKYNL